MIKAGDLLSKPLNPRGKFGERERTDVNRARETSLRFLNAEDAKEERRQATVDSKPVCICAREMKINGVVYTIKKGGESRNAGCRVCSSGIDRAVRATKM